MNLAEIRKKSAESRNSATAAPMERGAETDLPPAVDAIDFLNFEMPALPQDELTAEDLPYEPCPEETFPDDSAPLEDYSLEVELTAYDHEQLPEPPSELQVAAVAAAAEETCPPIPAVIAPARKRLTEYNPLETILSGRESATDADENAVSQALAYASEEVEEYLCFRVAHEEYAISIMAIKEIIKPRDVTEVPRMPAFITGVISLRGVIIPVMDMRLRLSLPVTASTGKERIIVLRMDTGFCGVLVDEVIQVARIKKSDLEEPPAVLDGIDRDFVTGLGHFDNRMLILLNLGSILDIGVH